MDGPPLEIVEPMNATPVETGTYLQGDEDGDVWLHCRTDGCPAAGRPLAFYTYVRDADGVAATFPLEGLLLPAVTTIEDLAYLARQHDGKHHSAVRLPYGYNEKGNTL